MGRQPDQFALASTGALARINWERDNKIEDKQCVESKFNPPNKSTRAEFEEWHGRRVTNKYCWTVLYWPTYVLLKLSRSSSLVALSRPLPWYWCAHLWARLCQTVSPIPRHGQIQVRHKCCPDAIWNLGRISALEIFQDQLRRLTREALIPRRYRNHENGQSQKNPDTAFVQIIEVEATRRQLDEQLLGRASDPVVKEA